VSRVVQEDLRLVNNLRETAKLYSNLKQDRADTAVKLYETFLKDYVFQYGSDKKRTADFLRKFFGKSVIKIVAIDGTKYERSRRGCLVFYVLAAPLVYELDLDSDNLRPIRVEEESVRNNVMALVPVPLSEIFLIGETPSIEVKEEEEEPEVEEELGDVFTPQKIGKIDVVLMKLAEIYTVYWCLQNVKPDVVMVDGSLFEGYSYSNRSVDRLNLYRGKVLGVKLDRNDFTIFKSIPISSELGIPSVSFVREFIVAGLLAFKGIKLQAEDLSFQSKLANVKVSLTKRQLENLQELDYLDITWKDGEIEIRLKDDYHKSWDRLKDLFLEVCEEGFGKNNLDAFRIHTDEQGRKSYRYMCEEDIETMCRIGYDMIFEECWKKGVLIFSITKDSFVRFFVDNFLTIAGPRHLGIFTLDQELLPRVPSTDAGMLYDISVRVPNLHAPLSMMEYDPAVSTIYSTYDVASGNYVLNQLRRVAQERQFMRSLVLASEEKSSGRKSYVYTIDRITYPKVDENCELMKVELEGKKYKFAYYSKPSETMKAIVSLIALTSSNRHDAVFGYPDPLYDVDQYVKTLGRAHLETLDLALTEIDLEEFSVTYRQLREMGGG